MCFSKKNAWIFFISLPLSLSPVTTGAGAGDRRACPGSHACAGHGSGGDSGGGARARAGHGSGSGGGGGDGSMICHSIEKNCDL